MADAADDADKTIHDAVQSGINYIRKQAAAEPVYYTACNWCGDPTENGHRYCSRECANDAFRYNCSLTRNGIKR
jgi:hypothetical protein